MSCYRGWIKSSRLKIIDTFGEGHWDEFERTRRKHNDNICEETNKLVLRLDKLINTETGGQKLDLDKSIVEWTLDDLVKLCPYCAKSFTLTRRRHHCRACGAILCSGCSKFLDYKSACKLVRPAKLYTDPYDRIGDNLETKSAEEMPKIRCCEDCKRLLDKRVEVLEAHYGQPTFLDVYAELRRSMAEADELMLSQSSIASGSIGGGGSSSRSSLGHKETSLELKTKIQNFRQAIAVRASKIKRMAEREPSAKQAYLLGAIQQSVAAWLKESLESKVQRVHGSYRAQGGRPGGGWVPEQTALADDCADESPLLIQIRNLEEYIRQAKAADRYEEVSALEANKRDLEIEYFIQQEDLSSVNLGATSPHDADGDGDGDETGLGAAAATATAITTEIGDKKETKTQ